MDEKLKEELIYHILSSASIIPVPLEDGDCMFLFRWIISPGGLYEKKTNFSSWKKLFFSTTRTVFYRGKIITDEPNVRVIKDVSGHAWVTSSSKHKVKKICKGHFRKIIECPEFLISNLFDDKIKISSPKYVTPVKNLLREVGLIKKKGPPPKYGKDKVNKAEKTYRAFLHVGKRITRKQQEIEKEKGAPIDGPGMSEINRKLKVGDFRLVKEVVLYGSTNMALRRTSVLENVPICQLKKMLHSRDYRERMLKRF